LTVPHCENWPSFGIPANQCRRNTAYIEKSRALNKDFETAILESLEAARPLKERTAKDNLE
jgi:hypothetical protein